MSLPASHKLRCLCPARSPSAIHQIKKCIAVVESNSGQDSASFCFPFKLVTFAPRLFAEVNSERVFHHLTNRYTFIGRFALELSAKLVADFNGRSHALKHTDLSINMQTRQSKQLVFRIQEGARVRAPPILALIPLVAFRVGATNLAPTCDLCALCGYFVVSSYFFSSLG